MNETTIVTLMTELITSKFYKTKQEAMTVLAEFRALLLLTQETMLSLIALVNENYPETELI